MLFALSDQCRLRKHACNSHGIFVRAEAQFGTVVLAALVPPSELACSPLAVVADSHGGHSRISTDQG